jgi:hypothetical protein
MVGDSDVVPSLEDNVLAVQHEAVTDSFEGKNAHSNTFARVRVRDGFCRFVWIHAPDDGKEGRPGRDSSEHLAVDDELFAHVVTQLDHQITIVELPAREVVQVGEGAELLDPE